MDFDIANQWPLIATPIGAFVFLWVSIAKGWLHTAREFEEKTKEADARVADLKTQHDARIEDLKANHAQARAAADAEIAHLRETAVSLAESVAIQSKVQEQQLQTAEIVKTVMSGLQRSTGHTGSQPKVSQGNS